jgi:hypothetical protein
MHKVHLLIIGENMNTITEQELFKALEEDTFVQDEINKAVSGYKSEGYYNTTGAEEIVKQALNNKNKFVRAFLLILIEGKSLIDTSYYGNISTYGLANNNNVHTAYQEVYNLHIKDRIFTLENSLIRKLLPANLGNRVIRVKSEQKIKDEMPELALNMFSFNLFKGYLKKQKKALTSAMALRYFKQLELDGYYRRDSELAVSKAYAKLLWESVKTPSIAFQKEIINSHFRPIKSLDWDSPKKMDKQFYIGSSLRGAGTLTFVDTFNVADSELKPLIIGVKRTTPLNYSEGYFYMDVLKNAMVSNINTETRDKIVEYITEVFEKEENRGVANTVFTLVETTSNSLTKVLKLTKEIK